MSDKVSCPNCAYETALETGGEGDWFACECGTSIYALSESDKALWQVGCYHCEQVYQLSEDYINATIDCECGVQFIITDPQFSEATPKPVDVSSAQSNNRVEEAIVETPVVEEQGHSREQRNQGIPVAKKKGSIFKVLNMLILLLLVIGGCYFFMLPSSSTSEKSADSANSPNNALGQDSKTAHETRSKAVHFEPDMAINWGPTTDILSPTEVINSGKLIEAFNASGTTSASDQTVNGVLFTGTSSLLPENDDSDCFSGDTGDEAYNALLSSIDYGGESATLKVGGGKLTVGTEYTIQLWYVDTRNQGQISVSDAETPSKVVTLVGSREKRAFRKYGLTGQFAVGTFVAAGSAQKITLKSAGSKNVHITAYQIRDRTSAQEMMANYKRQLSKLPKYSWDKISRWGYARKVYNKLWTDREVDIMGRSFKYIWVQQEESEMARFKEAYPDRIYCFNAYINLQKAYQKTDNPEHYLYTSKGNLTYYKGNFPRYNQANPDVREWWLNHITENAYAKPKSDVIFIDSIQKAWMISGGKHYDHKGRLVSTEYMEKAIIPLLDSIRDRLSKDFIIQGNFLRASTSFTPDGNLGLCSKYLHSSYLEGFEAGGPDKYAHLIHKGIEIVQQAVAEGKLIAPNFGTHRPAVAKELTIEQKRAKASAAMPELWARLNRDWKNELAEIYAYFDYKLAIFLIMAGEHSYFRFQKEVVVNRAGPDMLRIAPPFPEFDRKLGKPISEGVRVNDTTWVREFEYCKVTLNVDGGTADIDWSFRSDGKPGTENMALGKPAK